MLIRLIQLLCIVQYTALGFWVRKYPKEPVCRADQLEPWSYRGPNGPYFWGVRFPECKGPEQSPININTRMVHFQRGLSKLTLYNYDKPVTRATVANTGRTIEVMPTDGVSRSIYVHDELYTLRQLHFHWGEKPSCGSEHTIDGVQYEMELHFVHQNEKGQTAVVAVLFQEQRKETPELKFLIAQFPEVMYKDMSTELRSKLNLNHLLPSNPASFYRYQGSLTTPECTDDVTWSVLTDVLPVGKSQMKEFRKLYSATKSQATKKCKLAGNYRPVQPLNKRYVFISK